jgi:PAS domain S-box-containing protein
MPHVQMTMQDQDITQLQARNAALEQRVQELQAALEQQVVNQTPASRSVRLGATVENTTTTTPVPPISPEEPILKRALMALQRSERRYKALLQAHPEPIARCLVDGTITAANAAFGQYFGRSRPLPIGDSLWDLVSQDQRLREQLAQVWQQVNQAGQATPLTFEHRTLRAGQVHWVHWVVAGLGESPVQEIQLIGQNISDRKQLDQGVVQHQPDSAEELLRLQQANQSLRRELHRRQQLQQDLRRSEERHRSIVGALHEGVLVINPTGAIQACNSSAAQILGLSLPELRRSNLFDRRWQWVHDNGMAMALEQHPIQLTLGTGIPCADVILGVQHSDDRTVWLAVNAQPLFHDGQLLPHEVVISLADISQRKQAEHDRQDLLRREWGARSRAEMAQEQIGQILETVTDGFISFDSDWQFTYINREAAKVIGRSIKSLLGKVIWIEFPEFATSAVAKLLQQAMASPNSTEAVEYYPACDRWYSIRAYPSNQGLSIYFRDMTEAFHHVYERNQVEANLRETEERFRQLAENIPQVFWMYDLEAKRPLYISQACQEVLGIEVDRATHKTWDDWQTRIHPDDRAIVYRASQRAWVGQNGQATFRYTRPDGSQRWLLVRAFPVKDERGKVYRMAGIIEDISDRQQKENWLTLLESVILNANDAVVITEAEPVELPGPHIVFVNDAFSKMMGYERSEVIGKTPRILQGPKTDLVKLKSVRAALKRWEPVMAELINYRKDGSEVWIELSLFPVADTRGHYNYWVGIQRDITQRKQTEADIRNALAKERELSELKSRFVSTTSHEFRTPLSTILSSVDLLEYYAEGMADQQPRDRYLEHTHRIQNAAISMNHLLNDILIIEKAEANRWQLDPIELDLRAFFQNLVDEMQLNDQGYHRLVYQIDRQDGVLDQASAITAQMDERLLRQIFSNLLSNALKYSPPGEAITLTLTCGIDQIQVAVSDRGIGIPVVDQPRLFEPFHRATNVGAISGTGLGLAIVKQSVEVHQGIIQVQSEVDRGTTMTVQLPRRVKTTAS